MKRSLSAMLMICLCVTMLFGCSFTAPETASDLVVQTVQAMADVKSYNVLADLTMDISMSGETDGVEMSVALPVSMSMDMSVAGRNIRSSTAMEMSMDASVVYGDETEDVSEHFETVIDMYRVISDDNLCVTTYSSQDNAVWTVAETDMNENLNIIASLLKCDAVDMFANATMERVDNTYVVSVSFADMLANVDLSEIIATSDVFDSLDLSSVGFAENIGDAIVQYVFDARTYRLIRVYTEEIIVNAADFTSLGDMSDAMDFSETSVKIQLDIQLSDYDKVDVSTVVVPADVVSSAIPADGQPGIF